TTGSVNRAKADFTRSAAGRRRNRGRALTIHRCNVLLENPRYPGEPVFRSRGVSRGGRDPLQLGRLARGVYPVRQAVTWRMSSVISAPTFTTSPTTTIAGGRTPSCATRFSTCPSVELIVRCVGRVPSAITETGVSGLRPYLNSS